MHQINDNRVLLDVKAEDEMNPWQCSVEVSNMTLTDETLEIKYVLDLCCKVDRVNRSNLAVTKGSLHS
jgi:hypothetical protein